MGATVYAETWPPEDWAFHVESRPHHWHVVQTGEGPDVVLLHGTGAATHSWRPLIPHLASFARVTAIDLPGHGGTRLGVRMRSSLSGMSEDIATLLTTLELAPRMLVGHSAGAAIALRLAPKLRDEPKILGINPALQSFEGLAGVMFPVAARMMALTPGMVETLTWQMQAPSAVLTLLRGTGSDVPSAQMHHYARAFRRRSHVEGTLLMLSQWTLTGLQADLSSITTPCLFVTGSGDRMVPPVHAVEAASRMPHARVQTIDDRGHLIHEEDPDAIAAVIRGWI